MILRNLQLYEEQERKDLLIQDGSIATITAAGTLKNPTNIPFIDTEGLTAFPGFINSHDHLDFNLYPQLGKGPYPNYTSWGKDTGGTQNAMGYLQKSAERMYHRGGSWQRTQSSR